MDRVKDYFHKNMIYGDVRYWELQRDVGKLLAQTDLLLVTSLAESFCLAALEAMACGVPVVASRVGGLPEVVLDGHTGLLFDLDRPDQAVQSALDLLNDPERHQQMRISAYQHAQNYARLQGVLNYEGIYMRHLSAALNRHHSEIPVDFTQYAFL
jgi:glycosyltransferase involved in cell wall biosynthesis